jgi:hypothetical protein
VNLELPDRLPIGEVTTQAFAALGEGGLVRSAEGHACSECTHDYKQHADVIGEADPAGLVSLMDTGAGSGDGEQPCPMGTGASGSAVLSWGSPTFLCSDPGKETSAEG